MSYQNYLNIKDDILYETDGNGLCRQSLGIMAFFKMRYNGLDLKPLQSRIEQEIVKNPHNAAALLDSASLMFLTASSASGALKFIKGRNANALQRQQAAFEQTVFFKTHRSPSPSLRVLVLAAPGEITCNTPIEFLLQDDEIDTTYWYILPDAPEKESIPEHDIAVVIASLSDVTQPTIDRIEKMLPKWPKPVLNRIENLKKFARDQFFTYAKGISGLYIPETRAIARSDISESDPPYPYPFIIRPIKSFGGRGLSKIEHASDLTGYLDSHYGTDFFVSPFIDYSSADGLFRKYRIAVIDGKSFPCHMAISDKWALWYMNAEMAGNEKKLAEENDFLLNFDKDNLGKKYGGALNQLAERIGSEYFVLDCAETKTGELLIFEGGHDMVVHDMDSPILNPVKNEHMHRLFHAFQMMLKAHARK